jgi:hypothetical protein
MKKPTKGELITLLIMLLFALCLFCIGYFLDAMLYLCIVLIIINIINQPLDKKELKYHAPAVGNIHGYLMCNVITLLKILTGVLVMKITSETLPQVQAVLLGAVLIIFSCFNFSKIFYGEKLNFGKEKRESKYIDVQEYIMHNPLCPKLLEYENWLKENNNTHYLVLKYRFRDNHTFEKIKKLLKLTDTARVTDILDTVTQNLRFHCKF